MMMMMKAFIAHLLTSSALLLTSFAKGQVITTQINSFEILQQIPHDTNAFTQGLTFDPSSDGGVVYESTGIYGESDVRRVDISNGNVLQITETPSDVFGEGMAYKDGKLYHITWKSQRGFIFDADTLEELEQFRFETSNNEGWGITYDDDNNRFIVTDGSNNLHFWDVNTLKETGRVAVTMQLSPTSSPVDVARLNEIEYDPSDKTVLANVWQTNYIVRIDPSNGRVVTRYDLEDLYPNRAIGADVLNGIAIAPNDDLWVTGKKWPSMYQIRLGTEAIDPGDGSNGDGSTGGGGVDGCFSASSMVEVLGKESIPMKELAVGDKVRTSVDDNDHEQYQPVYAFGHYAPEATSSNFVKISFTTTTTNQGTTSSTTGALEVTKEHLIYLANKSHPVRADSIVIGDILQSTSTSPRVVQSIEKNLQRTGLYAPFTPTGTLIVDGVKASNYISLQATDSPYVQMNNGGINSVVTHHDMAHWFLTPYRFVCQTSTTTTTTTYRSWWCHDYNDEGLPPYVANGIHLARWLESLQLHYMLQVLLFTIASTAMACLILLEKLAQSPTFAIHAFILLLITAGLCIYTVPEFQFRIRRIKAKQM